MGMDSTLTVDGEDINNYKSRARFKKTFKKNKDGKFEPINIQCYYEEGYGELSLNIDLIDFDKSYTYEIENEDCLDFDLNEAVEELNLSKDLNKIRVHIYTYW